MKQITEDYVSYETAVLLKEKGFDENCHALYNLNTKQIDIKNVGDVFNNKQWVDYISAPTQSLALKWLREVHKLDIDVSIEYKNSKKVYYYSILKKTVIRDIDCLHSETNFDSYEQAVEAALKYTLENLI